jgi:PRC-barrel domain
MEKDQILGYRGETLVDRDGDRIGTIEEIYLDAESNEPEWALVHTGLFGTKRTFVPLREATERDGDLCVPVEKSTVKDAPQVEPNGQLSQREESELNRHYGLPPGA